VNDLKHIRYILGLLFHASQQLTLNEEDRLNLAQAFVLINDFLPVGHSFCIQKVYSLLSDYEFDGSMDELNLVRIAAYSKDMRYQLSNHGLPAKVANPGMTSNHQGREQPAIYAACDTVLTSLVKPPPSPSDWEALKCCY
jgi:hypothetical protein